MRVIKLKLAGGNSHNGLGILRRSLGLEEVFGCVSLWLLFVFCLFFFERKWKNRLKQRQHSKHILLRCVSCGNKIESCFELQAPLTEAASPDLSLSVTRAGFLCSRGRSEFRLPWVAIWAVHLWVCWGFLRVFSFPAPPVHFQYWRWCWNQ